MSAIRTIAATAKPTANKTGFLRPETLSFRLVSSVSLLDDTASGAFADRTTCVSTAIDDELTDASRTATSMRANAARFAIIVLWMDSVVGGEGGCGGAF